MLGTQSKSYPLTILPWFCFLGMLSAFVYGSILPSHLSPYSTPAWSRKMATHSSILAWKIPWTENPDRLQSTQLQRLRHDWATEYAHHVENHSPILFHLICTTVLMAQMVKNLAAMQETWVQSLGWEDPLEKGMTTHSSILAWRILGQRSLAGYIQSMGLKRVRHSWVTFIYIHTLMTGWLCSEKCGATIPNWLQLEQLCFAFPTTLKV